MYKRQAPERVGALLDDAVDLLVGQVELGLARVDRVQDLRALHVDLDGAARVAEAPRQAAALGFLDGLLPPRLGEVALEIGALRLLRHEHAAQVDLAGADGLLLVLEFLERGGRRPHAHRRGRGRDRQASCQESKPRAVKVGHPCVQERRSRVDPQVGKRNAVNAQMIIDLACTMAKR